MKNVESKAVAGNTLQTEGESSQLMCFFGRTKNFVVVLEDEMSRKWLWVTNEGLADGR